jgi:hypothetical protein
VGTALYSYNIDHMNLNIENFDVAGVPSGFGLFYDSRSAQSMESKAYRSRVDGVLVAVSWEGLILSQ